MIVPAFDTPRAARARAEAAARRLPPLIAPLLVSDVIVPAFDMPAPPAPPARRRRRRRFRR